MGQYQGAFAQSWSLGAAGAQVPYKHWVGGSNPSATTRYSTGHGFSVTRFLISTEASPRLAGLSGLPVSADVVPGSCQVSARFFRFRASFLQENDAFLEVCCQVFARIFGKAD